MIVQILGAKMLAPFIGTSHFVWTAQIAVTLVALAAGYYAGGRLADQARGLIPLYAALLTAALYLSAISLILRPVVQWCLQFNLALSALLASALLFFAPLFLMAMTTPFLIRFLTASVATVGGSVGRLTAVSTLGSFAGTMLIGYLLIPFLPNTVTLLLLTALLAALSLTFFVVWARRAPALKAAVATLLAGALAAALSWRIDHQPPAAGWTQLYRANSNFGSILVLEHESGTRRYLLNDLLLQNTYDPTTRQGLSTFTYALQGLAHAYTPNIRSALCIGLGIGLVPAELARGGAQVDVVEINPQVPRVAQQYFDCPLGSFTLQIGDGRQFVNRATNRYDTIILDAFLGDSSPSHLMSREAFAAMHALLNPNGTLVINCFADFHPRRDFFAASLDKTLRNVFQSVRIHATGSGNVYFVASDRDPLYPLRTPDFDATHPQVRGQLQAVFATLQHANPNHGIVLTDNYNPVDAFDAANREEIRRTLAQSLGSL
jgi:spermidine synthase